MENGYPLTLTREERVCPEELSFCLQWLGRGAFPGTVSSLFAEWGWTWEFLAQISKGLMTQQKRPSMPEAREAKMGTL